MLQLTLTHDLQNCPLVLTISTRIDPLTPWLIRPISEPPHLTSTTRLLTPTLAVLAHHVAPPRGTWPLNPGRRWRPLVAVDQAPLPSTTRTSSPRDGIFLTMHKNTESPSTMSSYTMTRFRRVTFSKWQTSISRTKKSSVLGAHTVRRPRCLQYVPKNWSAQNENQTQKYFCWSLPVPASKCSQWRTRKASPIVRQAPWLCLCSQKKNKRMFKIPQNQDPTQK